MTIKIKAIAAVVLAAGLISTQAYSADPLPEPAAKKHTKAAAKPKPVPAATAAELQELKQEMEGQINSLKQQLSDRDVQLKQAQDAAAAAQASASRAEAAASLLYLQQQWLLIAAVAEIIEGKNLRAPLNSDLDHLSPQ